MGIPLLYGVLGLAAFAGIYSIYGGLKAVAFTDVIQVVFLVGGGLITTYIALNRLGEGRGLMEGISNLYAQTEDKFHLILFCWEKVRWHSLWIPVATGLYCLKPAVASTGFRWLF